MRNLLIITALMLVVVFQSQAQRRGHQKEMDPEKMAEKVTDHMSEKLELNEDQKEKIYALHLERFKERKAQHEAMMEKRKAMHEKMKAEREEEQAKLEAILTPEQKAKWEEIKNERKEMRRKYRDARGHPDREKLKKLDKEKEDKIDG